MTRRSAPSTRPRLRPRLSLATSLHGMGLPSRPPPRRRARRGRDVSPPCRLPRRRRRCRRRVAAAAVSAGADGSHVAHHAAQADPAARRAEATHARDSMNGAYDAGERTHFHQPQAHRCRRRRQPTAVPQQPAGCKRRCVPCRCWSRPSYSGRTSSSSAAVSAAAAALAAAAAARV